MATRIQLRRDISANWVSNNPILAEGEIGIEIDTNKLKIGNGISTWNILNYYGSTLTLHSELTLDDGTNPHGTTKQDVGLSNVPNLNTTEAVEKAHTHSNKSVLDGTEESFTSILKTALTDCVNWISTNGANLTNHLTNFSNPHNVSKSQVGLGNADNTSDADKPISTAAQTALNNKLDKVTTVDVEKVYIKNADGTQGVKATSEFGGRQIYIENISVSGGYTVDFDTATHRLTLIGNTTFTEINLPPVGFSKTITLHINGNFGVVFPASWTQYISGAYKGTAPLNTIVVEAFGSFRKVQISQPD